MNKTYTFKVLPNPTKSGRYMVGLFSGDTCLDTLFDDLSKSDAEAMVLPLMACFEYGANWAMASLKSTVTSALEQLPAVVVKSNIKKGKG